MESATGVLLANAIEFGVFQLIFSLKKIQYYIRDSSKLPFTLFPFHCYAICRAI